MTDTPHTRLHQNLVRGVQAALEHSLIKGHPADKVIARLFKDNPLWGARDRAFVAETTYSIIRYLRHYTDGIGPSLRLLHVVGWYLQDKGYVLPPWPEWDHLPPKPVWPQPTPLAVKESITNWLDKKGQSTYGERWPTLMHALNKPAPVVLRVNPLRCTLIDAKDALMLLEIPTIVRGEWALELVERANVFKTEPFQLGWFEVQDLASQEIALALDIHPGQRIVDACAGAGGKTLHLAALAENKGQIIAMDPEEYKLQELRRRAARAGINNVEARKIDNQKTIKRLYGSADRLLLDVPCTGTGVLRRNPDTKWKLGQEVLDRCLTVQADILRQYTPMCKPGGRIVYATCSILKEENQDQVHQFLSEHPDYRLIEEKQLLPDDFGYDGFYLAVMERVKTPPATVDLPDAP
jgi:16S rRNA (cytosine967-C5)-methyltransferase